MIERNVPRLRFPEFKGEWAKSKLGSDCKILMCKRIFSEDTAEKGDVPFFKIGTIGGKPDAYISNSLFDEYREKYNYPRAGEILITCSGTVGKCVVFDGADAYFQDSNIVWIDNPKQTIRNEFLYYVLSNFNWSKLNSTTIARIYGDDLRNLRIVHPVDTEEQLKVSGLFRSIDLKLSHLKKKKSLLEQYKKGMMEKIFNQEMRFKDDDGKEFGEWEEKTFGEVADVKRGASPRPINDSKWFDEDSPIGWVRISDVTKSNKFLTKTTQYLSGEGIQKSRLVKKGNLIMSICATIGKPIYTDFDVCIHDGFVVFENLKGEREFFFYYLEMIQKKWYDYGQPGTQVNLNSEIVINEIIPFPSKEEQTKIANFLSAIDDKINLVSQQIDKREVWKKGLLGEMFV